MIAAPFLAGCPSAFDRALWSIVGSGMLDAVGWPPRPWAGALFLLPALVVILLGIWVWHARARNAAVAVALLALTVHPPLLVAIAPLLAPRRGEPVRALATVVRLVVVMSGSVAILQLAPDCRIARTAPALAVTMGILHLLVTSVGIIAGLLALLETIRAPTAPHTRVALMVIACSVVSVFSFERFDARVTLLPAAAALWWLAAAAAAAVIVARASKLARIGATLVLAPVPMLQSCEASADLPSRSAEPHTTAATVAAALDSMRVPSRLVTEDPAHDFLATVWAAGHGRRSAFFEIVADANTAHPEWPLYAFARGSERLTARGFLTGLVESGRGSSAVGLWRALSNERCELMRREWMDLTALMTYGQITGIFEQGTSGRHAVIWAALSERAAISPIGWPQIALPGLRVRGFDLTNPDERRQYLQAARADDLPLSLLPADSAFVVRVILGRIEPTPGALGVAFEILPTHLVGKLDPGANADRLELCGSAQDLAIVGYPDAPAVASLAVTSPAVAGAGWHVQEPEGDVRFRWTAADEVELRFIAVEPAPLTLQLHVLNAAADERREADAVILNGSPARCDAIDGRCEWVLPFEAVKVGLNVITVRAPVSRREPAATPLGLQVAVAELRLGR